MILFEKKFPQGVFQSVLGKPSFPVTSLHQVHGTHILHPQDVQGEVQADGLMARWDELGQTVLAIKSADCMPVLILGEKGLALIHAGWRGLQAGVLEDPKLLALSPTEAFIGPCIHRCCFEVGSDFFPQFSSSPCFMPQEEKTYFDLLAEAKSRMKQKLGLQRIDESGVCTCCTPQFPSFRRDKTAQRIWNLFIPLAQYPS